MMPVSNLKLWAALLAAIVAAAMVMIALLVEIKPAEAAFPGSTGDIAFIKNNGPDDMLYRVGADGYAPVNIGGNLQNWGYPSWSADGTHIVLTDTGNSVDNEVYLLRSDGSDPQNLTNAPNFNDFQPALNRDGSKVFFERKQSGGKSDIYMLNLVQPGSQPVQITNTPTFNESQPAISPDGTKIAFASDRDGDYDIYMMKAARESSTNVATKLTKTSNVQAPDLAAEGFPDWSPDGKQLAFARVMSQPSLNLEIFRMKAAPQSKTNRPVNLTKSSATNDGEPAWSPDGRKIAFTSGLASGGDTDIYRMKATDGANKVDLSNDPANRDRAPSWQPLP